MTTEQTLASTATRSDTPKRSLMTAVWVVVAVAVLGAIAYHARMGAVSPRIANPEVTGVPRPVEFLFGWDGWIALHQIGTVIMMLLLVAVCVWAWRRHPAHPYLLMVLASTAIVWQDPIMNWAPFAVYNPQLWHFPEDWPLVRLSPTVESDRDAGADGTRLAPREPRRRLLHARHGRWRRPTGVGYDADSGPAA